MTYLLTHFWAWGVSAFAVGIATALSVVRRPERGPVAGWLVWFALAFAAGLPVAALALLPGRSGFWLEMALMLFPAFLVGSALGALLGRHSLRDNEGWAIGLVPLALIWLGADFLAERSVEQDLKRKAASAIEKVGGDPAYLDVAGRDILLPRDAANRAAAEEQIAHIPGVRGVAEVEALTGSAAKAYENALAARRAARESERTTPAPPEAPAGAPQAPAPDGAAVPAPPSPTGPSARSREQPRLGGVKPAPSTPSAPSPELARPSTAAPPPSEPAGSGAPAANPAAPGARSGAPTTAARGEGSGAPAANAAAPATRPGGAPINSAAPSVRPAVPSAKAEQGVAEGSVPPSGELDVSTCQRAVSAALAREPVQFSRRGAGVRRRATGALDKAVGLLQRCPQTEVEARVRAEGGDRDARRLARDRAARVVDYLGRMGVERGRLSVAGESGGPVSKDAPESESGSGVDLLLSPRR